MPGYDDDEEVEYDEDEDECDEDDDDEEEDEDDDDDGGEAEVGRIEEAYRIERARVRRSEDIHELSTMRSEYNQTLTRRDISQAARIRIRDLIEQIDDRVTTIKAKRMSGRRW
jgi:hypothetical protein